MTANHSNSPPEGKGVTVYAVDAHSLIFQVFHALPEMTSPRGEAVGAVFGFSRDIMYLIEEKKPDYLFCAFDMSGPTFRHEMYDQYKIDRTEMPEELQPQIPKIRDVLESLGVPILESEGYEADDVLATLARICDEQQINCFIVTSDKDCRQLISEHVRLYNVRKNQVMDAAALEKDWGVRPDQVIDFQALVGDKTDNVPGIDLIGPKTATELLQKHDTLDAVLDAAPHMKKGKRQKNLMEGREKAMFSRDLVRLDRHVPIEIDWEAGRVGGIDTQRAAELFAQFGFRSLGEKIHAMEVARAPALWDADYRLINTPETLAELIEQMSAQEQIALDTETTHLLPRWARLVGLSFGWEPGVAYYVALQGPSGARTLDRQETLGALRPVLENASIRKIGQNLKYDQIVLRAAGVDLAGIAFDTMVASYLLDAGERNHGLDDLSKRFLNHPTIPIKELIGSGKNQQQMDEVPLEQITEYAGEDADVCVRLEPILAERLRAAELEQLNRNVELPLLEVLAEMEYTGIRVDTVRLAALSAKYTERLAELEQEIHALAGRAFNIASPKQLAEVLFDELKLPVVKRTKSGPSTDADVLARLATDHALPAKIVEHRQFAKLKGTYVDALPALVHPETKRVHASFNQVVTATGRLSSSDPNLQNIPVRTETGREIRSAFLPREGWKLLAADYSQIELRVLAHFTGDAALCEAFEADQDIHARVASEVYGVSLADVTPEMRRTAKAVNFGVIYGQTPYGLSAALGIEKAAAAAFIESYFARYPDVDKFLTKTLAQCRENGYVRTILGRRRAIRGVRAGAGRQRNLPERTAINTVIQGSAADLIKLAMVSIFRRLEREQVPAKMLLQIHDELIFEVPSQHLDHLGDLVSAEMGGVLELRVPLKVDLKSGENWAACEPW